MMRFRNILVAVAITVVSSVVSSLVTWQWATTQNILTLPAMTDQDGRAMKFRIESVQSGRFAKQANDQRVDAQLSMRLIPLTKP